jgi:hypothetical protein
MFVGVRTYDGGEVWYLSTSSKLPYVASVRSGLAGSFRSERGRVIAGHPKQVGFLRAIPH